jgi:hypothetical protein
MRGARKRSALSSPCRRISIKPRVGWEERKKERKESPAAMTSCSVSLRVVDSFSNLALSSSYQSP